VYHKAAVAGLMSVGLSGLRGFYDDDEEEEDED
jgi:hypothetical protein